MLARTVVLVALVVLVVAVLTPSAARAQAPSDFKVFGSLDLVVDSATGSQETFTVGTPIWYTGWAGECRSGLQPQTQRVGRFAVQYARVVPGAPPEKPAEPPTPPVLPVFTVQRPDAAAVVSGQCPAIGPHIGYWVLAPAPPEPGDWYLWFLVITTDGAGREASFESQPRIITVLPAAGS